MPIVFPSAAELVSPLTAGINSGVNIAQARLAGQHLEEQRRHAMVSEELERQLRDIQKQQEARADIQQRNLTAEQNVRNAAEARAADEFNLNKAFTGAIGDDLKRQQVMNAIPSTIRRPDYVPPASQIDAIQQATVSALGKAPPSPEMLQHVLGSAATMGNQELQRNFEMMRLEDSRKRLGNEDIRLRLAEETQRQRERQLTGEAALEKATKLANDLAASQKLTPEETSDFAEKIKANGGKVPDPKRQDIDAVVQSALSLAGTEKLNDLISKYKGGFGPVTTRVKEAVGALGGAQDFRNIEQAFNSMATGREFAIGGKTLTKSKIDAVLNQIGDPRAADFPQRLLQFRQQETENLGRMLTEWENQGFDKNPKYRDEYKRYLALYEKNKAVSNPSEAFPVPAGAAASPAQPTGNVITLKNGAKVTIH
jgi:hypothetical protein